MLPTMRCLVIFHGILGNMTPNSMSKLYNEWNGNFIKMQMQLLHWLLFQFSSYIPFQFFAVTLLNSTFTPSNFILLFVPMRYLCCGSVCVVFWSGIFVLFEPYVRFPIFRKIRVTEWPPIGEYLLTRLTICFLVIST